MNCVLVHWTDPERPRQASTGFVCEGCRKRMERDLYNLVALFEEMVGARVGESEPLVSGSRDPKAPLAAEIAEHRDKVHGCLSSWARVVVEDRDVSSPLTAEQVVERVGMARLSVFLTRHLDWFCHQEFIDEFAAEIGALRWRAFSLAYPSNTRRFTVGRCTEIVAMDDAEPIPCPGTLTALIRDDADLLPSQLVCDFDEDHSVPASSWVALGRRLKAAETKETA